MNQYERYMLLALERFGLPPNARPDVWVLGDELSKQGEHFTFQALQKAGFQIDVDFHCHFVLNLFERNPMNANAQRLDIRGYRRYSRASKEKTNAIFQRRTK